RPDGARRRSTPSNTREGEDTVTRSGALHPRSLRQTRPKSEDPHHQHPRQPSKIMLRPRNPDLRPNSLALTPVQIRNGRDSALDTKPYASAPSERETSCDPSR
ncbi:Unknown protein, partial [Striga hermonthica]